MILRTPLYEEHLRLKAKMGVFAGWQMPIYYSSILEEHNAVRHKSGLFDAGHMGVIKLSLVELKKLEANFARPLRPDPGRVQYNVFLNQDGGVSDDLLVYFFDKDVFVVSNAVNTDKIMAIFRENSITHKLTSYKVLALQGPQAFIILNKLVHEASKLPYFRFREASLFGKKTIISRTGYTGEDGFEFYTKDPLPLWQFMSAQNVTLCGLGARDVLRLEAALPLYGHELLESRPYLSNRDLFCGIVLEGKHLPRQGHKLYQKEKEVGEVTSGTFSPSLAKPIAIVLLKEKLIPNNDLYLRIREQNIPAVFVDLPFYHRET